MTYDAEFIEGTPIKTLWLEIQLSSKFKEHVKVQNVAPLGEEAVGYMSVIRRIFLSGSPQAPSTVIVKTPSAAGGMQAVKAAGGEVEEFSKETLLQESFHDTECDILELLNVGDHNVKIPKIYFTEKSKSEVPCIVMEDIVDSKVIELIPGFDEAQLYIIVDQIVELQHWSLNNPDSWRFPLTETQDELEKGVEPMITGMLTAFFTKHKDYFGDLGEKLINHTLKSRSEYPTWFRQIYYNKERPSVLVHGDMWSANFLWRDGSIAAIVDWQLTHPGNVVEDLMRVLATCTTSDIRRKLTSSLLNHYYNLLLAKNNNKLPFTREDLDEEVKLYLPVGCMWSTFATAFWENSILKTEDKLNESLDRLKTYIEDTALLLNW